MDSGGYDAPATLLRSSVKLNCGARDDHESPIVMTDVDAGLHSEVGAAAYPLGRPRVLNLPS